MIYGVDVSAYQPNFDFAAAKREGFDFAFIKATEGSGWKSAYYNDQIARARAADMLFASYHFLRSDVSIAAQVDNVRSMVAPGAPVLPDVEWIKDKDGRIISAPTEPQTREFVALLRAAGFTVPLIYFPQWYWAYLGRPNLSGLPPNWHSRYPDDVVRRKDGFALGAEYWPSFGGIDTVIAQFTSSLAVANYPSGRIDGNAFRGTRAELQALLNGDDDMSWSEPIEVIKGDEKWTDPASAVVGSMLGHVLQSKDDVGEVLNHVLEMKESLADIAARVERLELSGVPVTAEVDLPAVAKAVNDDADARDRDNNPDTGTTS